MTQSSPVPTGCYRVYFTPPRRLIRQFSTASEARAYVRRFNQAMQGAAVQAHLWQSDQPLPTKQ